MNNRFARQRGAMLVTSSLFMIFLIGLAAVVVDVGHMMTARNALQNAADAAALAGASCLTRSSAPSGQDCTSTPSASLNWAMAKTKAELTIRLNHVDGVSLVDGTVTTGYKNMAGTPANLQATTLSPVGAYDKPAVWVQLRKAPGSNGGPLQMLMTNLYGASGLSMTVTAVAVISSPATVPPNTLIPYAINQCMFNLYWDAARNAPRLATRTSLNGVPQVLGQPWVFRIGSSYHYPDCESGQWTSFGSHAGNNGDEEDEEDEDEGGDAGQSKNRSSSKSQFTSANLSALSIGDLVAIQPGTKTALYNSLDAQYPTPPGADVTLAVVNQADGLDKVGSTPVVGFAGFHITDIRGGSDKYIQGQFIQNTTTAGASGVGAYFGTYTPPRLAQ
jgi:Flp pilus assembly protein TadG